MSDEVQKELTEGLTIEEKKSLMQDLNAVFVVMQSHDQSLFQLIAGLNVIQDILIDKGIVTKEELISRGEAELESIKASFLNIIAENNKETTPDGK